MKRSLDINDVVLNFARHYAISEEDAAKMLEDSMRSGKLLPTDNGRRMSLKEARHTCVVRDENGLWEIEPAWALYDKDKQPAGAPPPIGDDGIPLFCDRCGRGWADVSSLLCGEGDKCICDECIQFVAEAVAKDTEAKGGKQGERGEGC